MSNKIKLFGLKKNDKLIYIGKTRLFNKEKNEIPRRPLYGVKGRLFNNIPADKIEVVPIDITTDKKWFDDKLINILFHKDGNSLKNAKHLLKGKRGFFGEGEGYWVGKKKDKHTLIRLSESKHKGVYQYDNTGKLIKSWKSIKDAATKVTKDYEVINGGGCSKLYSIVDKKKFKHRLKEKFFWIKEEEFKYFYPKATQPLPKINLKNLIKKQEESLPPPKPRKIPKYKWIYSVEEYYNNILVKKHKTTYHAAKHYNVKTDYISKLCRGVIKNQTLAKKGTIFKYGVKIKVSYSYSL
jgi:hypothetical protein